MLQIVRRHLCHLHFPVGFLRYQALHHHLHGSTDVLNVHRLMWASCKLEMI